MSDTTDANKQIQYQLSVSPTEVVKLLSDHTEAFHLSTAFFIEQDYKKEFEIIIRGDQFRLYWKPRLRGGINSYVPWLCSRIASTQYGSKVYVWFELDKRVKFLDRTFVILYSLVTIIGLAALLYHVVFGMFGTGDIVFLIVTGVSWFIRHSIKSRGTVLAKREKTAGLQFLDRLFEPVKFTTKAEELIVQKQCR